VVSRERLVLELPSFAPGSNPWPAAAALGLCHLCSLEMKTTGKPYETV